MLFLRFTPLIPNVSVNVAAPIVGLPFKYFFFGTLFGIILYRLAIRIDACKYHPLENRLGFKRAN
jgi:uncharacterized membrane protein YdjX (TVP38/TMEM64 family)